MEGMHGSALARAASAPLARCALVALAAIAFAACASAPPKADPTLLATFVPNNSGSVATPSPQPTDVAADQIPDAPTTTSAAAVTKPQRGVSAPVGAVVFGTDVSAAGKSVNIVGERTMFAAGHDVAWRVTLPAATGGESVRVTLTTADNTETQVDEFIASAGWNVYYGKSLLTVAPGTYVLHYFVDGHEIGSGTFKIKAADVTSATPAPYFVPTDAPMATPQPTA